jgi:phosphoglucosamine mutase
MERLPQVLRNVKVVRREGLQDADRLWDEVAAVEAELGGTGRVLLRPSGTEPVVRVMAEATSTEQAEAAVERLCRAVVRELGAPIP